MTGIHTISFDNARITLQESSKPKLYFPSTINTDYLLWHTQSNVYAFKPILAQKSTLEDKFGKFAIFSLSY